MALRTKRDKRFQKTEPDVEGPVNPYLDKALPSEPIADQLDYVFKVLNTLGKDVNLKVERLLARAERNEVFQVSRESVAASERDRWIGMIEDFLLTDFIDDTSASRAVEAVLGALRENDPTALREIDD